MPVFKITKAGDPLLQSIAQPVTEFDSSLESLIQKLFDNFRYFHGVGIAAPQIGISKRVVVYGVKNNPRYPDAPFIEESILINPEIIEYSEDKNEYFEGCLSLPNIRGMVPRANRIKYKTHTVTGKLVEKTAEGFEARIIQHEIDHLNGLLYPMRMLDLSTFKYTVN